METLEIKTEAQIVPSNSTSAVETPLENFQKTALENAEKDYKTLKERMDNAVYVIDIDKKSMDLLFDYIMKDAPWKFTECLGILEVEKELRANYKAGKFSGSPVALEAIYYYMSKVQGNGKFTDFASFKSIEDYLKVLKPISAAIEMIKMDTEQLKKAEFIVSSRREGIDTAEKLDAPVS